MPTHVDAAEATARFLDVLQKRGVGFNTPYNIYTDGVAQIIVDTHYHGSYQLRYFKSVATASKQDLRKYIHEDGLGERVEYVVQRFGNGDPHYVTLNMGVAVDLLEKAQKQSYFGALLADGRMYWRTIEDTYSLAMRFNLVVWQPTNGPKPFILIPLGWLIPWVDVLVAPPSVVE